MWLITTVLKFLSSGALKSIFVHLEKSKALDNDKTKLDNEVLKEAIKAEIEERKVINEQMRIEHGWAVTRWIRPSLIYPVAFYQAAIYLDSIFQFSWDVARVPPEQEKWAGIMLMFYFGGRTIEKVAKILKS